MAAKNGPGPFLVAVNGPPGPIMAAINGPPPAIIGPEGTIRGSQKWSLKSCLTGPLRQIIKYNYKNK